VIHPGLILIAVLVSLVTAAGPATRPGIAPAAAGTTAVQDMRPNIVVISTDDQDLDMLQYMPRVRELLGDHGLSFSNAFVTLPSCSPSHTTMITGQYAHNHGVMVNTSPLGGFVRFQELDGEQSTVGTWLQGAGYRTGRIGRSLVGYPNGSTHVPPGWDDWRTFYDGYTPFTQYALNENGRVVHYGTTPADYIVDVLAERAVSFIEEADPRPFVLFLAPPAPHSDTAGSGPTTPAVRHRGRYAELTAPRRPSFNEDDVSDKPAAMQARAPLTERQIAEADYEYRSRAESLLAVDEAVERLVESLEAAGKLDNT
jgi:arylsulfatase A-like enzyme